MLELNIIFEQAHISLVALKSMYEYKEMHANLLVSQNLVTANLVSIYDFSF